MILSGSEEQEKREATRDREERDRRRAIQIQESLDHEERRREASLWEEQQLRNPVPNPLLLPREG